MQNSSKLHQRKWFSFATAVAMVGFVWLAFQNFQAERRYSNVVYLANTLQRSVPVSPQAIHDFLGEALAMVDAGECRSDLLNAGVTVVLADLDANASTASEEARTAALKSADRFMLHVLSCTPTDGDVWARLAMIRQALGSPSKELAALMERSSWYAPAEGTTLRARLEIWRHAADDVLAAAEPALDHDILTVSTYFPLKAAADVLAGGSQRFQDRVISVSASLNDERVAGLRKAGLDILPARASERKTDAIQ